MSSALSYARPLEQDRENPRHIEIVSSRQQRRARPRVVYALVTVAGLFTLFIAQLLLSIVISDGAYQISSLQSRQVGLAREERALSENLALLGSQQNLAAQAESLGMVLGSTTPVFLRLSDSTIIGAASPAGTGSAIVGSTGSLVPNSLLADIPLVTPAVGTGAATAGALAQDGALASSGAAGAPMAPESVPSEPGVLPSPVTR